MQLLHVVPKSWKNNLSDMKENTHNMVFQAHHLIRKHYLYFLTTLSNYFLQFSYLSK